MKYFAYGSNMLLERLKNRVPSADSPVIAELTGYKLKFHKKSTDGSAKCNIVKSNDPESCVYGVIFDIDQKDKPSLDKFEGLNSGYVDEVIDVISPDGLIKAHAYRAEKNAIDDDSKPYDWYKEIVLKGAIENNLPQRYIDELKTFESIVDQDKIRANKNKYNEE